MPTRLDHHATDPAQRRVVPSASRPPSASTRGFDLAARPTRNGTETLITVTGRFDELIAPTLQRTLDRLRLTDHDRVVLDLEALESVDPAGLQIVLGLRERCLTARCELIIRAAPPVVHRVPTEPQKDPSS